ncbi:MAG: diguanylate cyclase, partial [Firmicutes bacterium]|nr:diguanylate cyclase [Candidatus Scybalomonas excrementavium]
MSNMPTIGLEYPEEMTLEDIFYNFNSKERRSYAFVEMNIKNFQYFNARYGRQYGDEILERVDKILVEFLKNRGYIRKREGDTYH